MRGCSNLRPKAIYLNLRTEGAITDVPCGYLLPDEHFFSERLLRSRHFNNINAIGNV